MVENFQFIQESHHVTIQSPYTQIGSPAEFDNFRQWLLKLQTDDPKRIPDEFASLTQMLANHNNITDAWKKHPECNRYHVPDDLDSLRHFLNYVKLININMATTFYANLQHHKRGPPIVFHCSAGIGRSAALVALDVVTECMLHHSHVDVFDLITKMRNERYHTIHTKIQLLFIYQYVVSLAAHSSFHLVEKSPSSASTSTMHHNPRSD